MRSMIAFSISAPLLVAISGCAPENVVNADRLAHGKGR